MLYVVPTPIGNLDDITLRAIDVLQDVDIILAEDTRTSGVLLKKHRIKTQMWSFHAHNEHKAKDALIDDMLNGKTFALISDAGTPGISDPGFLLIRAAIEKDIEVTILPGATAFVPGLLLSGFSNHHFHYEGFLPHKKGRQTRLKWLATYPYTFVLYESPHRVVKCLKQLAEFCGEERRACVCREISKKHEEAHRGTLAELIEEFSAKEKVRGEIVIVVESAEA